MLAPCCRSWFLTFHSKTLLGLVYILIDNKLLSLLSAFGIKYGDNKNNKEDEGQGDDADDQEEPAPELLDLALELSDFDDLLARTTARS